MVTNWWLWRMMRCGAVEATFLATAEEAMVLVVEVLMVVKVVMVEVVEAMVKVQEKLKKK